MLQTMLRIVLLVCVHKMLLIAALWSLCKVRCGRNDMIHVAIKTHKVHFLSLDYYC